MNPEEKRKLVIVRPFLEALIYQLGWLTSPTSQEFAREARVWAGLDDPHIVPIVGFYLDEILDRAWLISPYMGNGNVRYFLNRMKPDMRVRLRMVSHRRPSVHCIP